MADLRVPLSYASPAALRSLAPDSGPRRFATPFLCGSFIHYSMPVSRRVRMSLFQLLSPFSFRAVDKLSAVRRQKQEPLIICQLIPLAGYTHHTGSSLSSPDNVCAYTSVREFCAVDPLDFNRYSC